MLGSMGLRKIGLIIGWVIPLVFTIHLIIRKEQKKVDCTPERHVDTAAENESKTE